MWKEGSLVSLVITDFARVVVNPNPKDFGHQPLCTHLQAVIDPLQDRWIMETPEEALGRLLRDFIIDEEIVKLLVRRARPMRNYSSLACHPFVEHAFMIALPADLVDLLMEYQGLMGGAHLFAWSRYQLTSELKLAFTPEQFVFAVLVAALCSPPRQAQPPSEQPILMAA